MNYGRRGAIIYAVAIRDIRTFPDEVLERASTEVPSVGDDIRRLMDDMLETMYWGGGIGLAAPQVGMPLRVIVIDTGCGKGGFLTILELPALRTYESR